MSHDASFDLKGFTAAEMVQQQFRNNVHGDVLFGQEHRDKPKSTKDCVSI